MGLDSHEFWTANTNWGGRIREFYVNGLGTIHVEWNQNDPDDLPKIRFGSMTNMIWTVPTK